MSDCKPLTLMHHQLSYLCKILFCAWKTSVHCTSVEALIFMQNSIILVENKCTILLLASQFSLSSLMSDAPYSGSLTWHLVELYLHSMLPSKKTPPDKTSSWRTYESQPVCETEEKYLSKTDECICEVKEYV